MEEKFLQFFHIISKTDAKKIWDSGNKNFLVLAHDGTDRYADCFETWQDIEKAYPDALFGLEKE